MATIAEWRTLGCSLAATQIPGFLLCGGKFNRPDICSCMASIAKRLILGQAASTPIMVAWFKFDCKGTLLYTYGLGHDFSFRDGG
jgi:hypothetical protein